MAGPAYSTIIGDGLWRQNQALVALLGLCPLLATTTSATNGLGMGMATTAVLVLSNLVISLIRDLTRPEIRLPIFVLVIASFVTAVELVMQANFYELSLTLGIFIPLIVVICIPLARAEAFCYEKGVLPSFADGLGMGLGYTISLTVLAIIREVLGNGTFFNQPIAFLGPNFQPYSFMTTAPGAFVCLGLMLCIMNMLGKK